MNSSNILIKVFGWLLVITLIIGMIVFLAKDYSTTPGKQILLPFFLGVAFVLNFLKVPSSDIVITLIMCFSSILAGILFLRKPRLYYKFIGIVLTVLGIALFIDNFIINLD